MLGLILLFTGCGPEDFLNPLYTENDLVSDPLLQGVWQQKVDEERWVLKFQPVERGCYKLAFSASPEDTGDPDSGQDKQPLHMKFAACLVQLGQTRFLDLQPTQIPIGAVTETFHLNRSPHSGSESPFKPDVFHTSDGLFITVAPAHPGNSSDSPARYELRLTPPHWIFKFRVDETMLRLTWLEPPGEVETLSTKELQRLVIQHADDPDFFSSEGTLEFPRQIGESL